VPLDVHFINTLPVLVPRVIPAKAGIQETIALGTGCPPTRAWRSTGARLMKQTS